MRWIAFFQPLRQNCPECCQERRDLFQDIVSEALEDIALIKAIDEGKDSEPVSRETIFAILESECRIS